jgi:hypothetical protein
MGEKKGQTEKLKLDFTSNNLEVYLTRLERWHRVTSREFRSWNGQRRTVTYGKDNEIIAHEYNGPLYYYATNVINKDPKNEGVEHLITPDPIKPREWESFE